MASATEAELGGFFENCQKATSTQTALAETDHSQPLTPVATYNTVKNRILNGREKIQSNRHDILLGTRQNKTTQNYATKIFEADINDTEKSKDWQTG